MSNITLLGIDLAKNVYQLHGVDEKGKAQLKRRLKRTELPSFIANLPPCTIAIEACGGSHHWARQFKQHGHTVKIISPQHVKPFVKGNKNDKNDSEAITEAASRPSMRFVSVKNIEGQDIQSIHRVRNLYIKNRTGLANQIRGLLAEYGVVVPIGIAVLRKRLSEIIADDTNELTAMIRPIFNELYEDLLVLDDKVESYDKKLQRIANSIPACKELLKIPGIGPKTATACYADLGDPWVYKNGRNYSANLGLVPKQHSSGERQHLMGISKRGDSYLRQLLIHGARSVLKQVDKKTDKRSLWLKRIKDKGGMNKAAVALANKNARIIWAMMANKSSYQANLAVC